MVFLHFLSDVLELNCDTGFYFVKVSTTKFKYVFRLFIPQSLFFTFLEENPIIGLF